MITAVVRAKIGGKAFARQYSFLQGKKLVLEFGPAAGSLYDQTEKTTEVFKITQNYLPGSFRQSTFPAACPDTKWLQIAKQTAHTPELMAHAWFVGGETRVA